MDKADFYAEARNDLAGPLEGVKVVEATTTWAGPMAGCVFADLGAEVVKVELPCGEVARRLPPYLPERDRVLSFMHTTVNRNKQSLSLDLHNPRGRDIFLRLIETADVLIENFRPGAMKNWGLSYADIRGRKPDIVYISISGYGQFGPDHGRAGYDPMAQASAGFMAQNGAPDSPPVKSPTFISDDLAGLHGAIAALAALRHRDQTGEGQHVDIALLDSLLFQSNGYLTLGALGVPMPRMGSQFVVAAPADVYRCEDGWVMAGVLLDSHWKILARVMERPELADDPRYATTAERVSRRSEVNDLLALWIANQPRDQVVTRLIDEGLPASPVRTYADAAADPHVHARDMLQEVMLEDGKSAPITGPAAKFSRTPTKIRHGAPALGQHNDMILADLGLSEAEIQALREEKVI